jgi:hypothetical protein
MIFKEVIGFALSTVGGGRRADFISPIICPRRIVLPVRQIVPYSARLPPHLRLPEPHGAEKADPEKAAMVWQM